MKNYKIYTILLLWTVCLPVYAQIDITGTWKTYPGMAVRTCHFDSAGRVSCKSSGCMFNYERNGTYKMFGDTISIKFRPPMELEYLEDLPGDSLKLIAHEQDSDHVLANHNVEVFYEKGESFIIKIDSTGTAWLPDYHKIDSVMFLTFGSTMNYQYKFRKEQIQTNYIKAGVNPRAWFLARVWHLDPYEKWVIVSLDMLCSAESLQPESTYRYCLYEGGREKPEEPKVDSNGLLNFRAKDYGDSYVLEHYAHHTWTKIDTFSAKGADYLEVRDYPMPIHSGLNKFRMYVEPEFHYFKYFEVESKLEKVRLESRKVTNSIRLNRSSPYELLDQHGNIILKGSDKIIDCSSLEKAVYYLNVDNQILKIRKVDRSPKTEDRRPKNCSR